VVVHLAAVSGVIDCINEPANGFSTNVIGTFNAIENARLLRIKRVILASSGAVTTCTTPYHAHKRFGEDYALASYLTYGTSICALRFSNIYGPGCLYKNSVVAAFFKEAITKGTITIEGDGQQTRDFVHVSDVVRAIAYASCNKFQGTLNIASGVSTSIKDLAKKIASLTGASLQYKAGRLNDVKHVHVDIIEAQEVLGWRPITYMNKELNIIYDYFLDNIDTPFTNEGAPQ